MVTDRARSAPAAWQGSTVRLRVELYRAALLAADELLRSETLDEAQLERLGEVLDAIRAALAGR